MKNRTYTGLLIASLGLPSLTLAQEMEEVIITGVRDTSTVSTEDSLVAPPDTAQLLRLMPGANINKNGELTGIAQYRGMFGNRIKVSINGSPISSGGPNAMDAPLHYAPVALLESLSIRRGIAPVSSGQETIGGAVEAITYKGDFSDSADLRFNSRIYAGTQSVNSGTVGNAFFSVANRNHLARVAFMHEDADDSEFAKGEILPSEYQRQRYDLGYSYQRDNHHFSIDFARNETGDAGTTALPMDILSVDSDLWQAKYRWEGDDYSVSTNLYYNDIEHWMTNYHLRRPPQNGPMFYRQTFALSDNYGFDLKLERPLDNGLIRYGFDGHFARHDADISNPNAAPFFINNFNDSERDLLGVYLEREMNLSPAVGFEGGVRVNQVSMDSATVAANLNPMNLSGMPMMMNNMAAMIGTGFNNGQREQNNTNVDWFARVNLNNGGAFIWYAGVARKTRSPSYQERYLWLPMEATGGLADGKTYVGNLSLKPEVAHELEMGFDYSAGNLNIFPRLFYKKVADYIQGTPAANTTVNQFAQMMANMGMGAPNPLQFNNVDAALYGLDLESDYQINSRLSLRAVLSIVRGERRDIDDKLYRISPDNIILALDYQGDNWLASLESVSYDRQDRISATNLEKTTSGYSVLNASFKFALSQSLDLGLGVNNMLDKYYLDHLAGYNRAFNTAIPLRERLPGLGRNFYGRMVWKL